MLAIFKEKKLFALCAIITSAIMLLQNVEKESSVNHQTTHNDVTFDKEKAIVQNDQNKKRKREDFIHHSNESNDGIRKVSVSQHINEEEDYIDENEYEHEHDSECVHHDDVVSDDKMDEVSPSEIVREIEDIEYHYTNLDMNEIDKEQYFNELNEAYAQDDLELVYASGM